MLIIKRFTPKHNLSNSYITIQESIELKGLLNILKNPETSEENAALAEEWLTDLEQFIAEEQQERRAIYYKESLPTFQDLFF